jgi:hypothetical protein
VIGVQSPLGKQFFYAGLIGIGCAIGSRKMARWRNQRSFGFKRLQPDSLRLI